MKKYDMTYSAEVKGLYKPWGKSYINGTTKVFFIPSVRFGREIVEFAEQVDIEYETVTIDRFWDMNKWGFGDFYGQRGGIWDFDVMYQNLENVLTSDEHFDVLVIPGINGWGYFTEKTRKAILKRVEEGAGLVLTHPYTGKGLEKPKELDILSPLVSLYEEGFDDEGYPKIEQDKMFKDRWEAGEHYITKGIPFNLFPYDEMAYYPYEAAGDVIIRSESGRPIGAVKEYGKGRIAAFGYYPRDIMPQHNGFTGRDETFDPILENWAGAKHSCPFDYLKYFYMLIARSIIWTAKKESTSTIESAELNEGIINTYVNGIDDGQLYCKLINEYEEVVMDTEMIEGKLQIPEWIKLGGRYRGELFLKQGDQIMDWYTMSFEYPYKANILNIELDKDNVAQDDILTANIHLEGDDCEVKVEVIDDYGRIIWTEEYEVTDDKAICFTYKVDSVMSINIRVVATLFMENHIIHKIQSSPIIVTPNKRIIDDFEVLMCHQNRGQGDLLPHINRLFIDMGVSGTMLGDTKLLAMSGGKGLGVYWYHRAAYTEQKENYLRTRDKKYLIRKPCLNDPDFWKDNNENIVKNVSNNKKYGPIAYFAQDEGSLTCYTDEFDLCFCEHCMGKMREWLKTQYKDLDELNSTWGTYFTRWEQVEPYTSLEAKKTGDYGSWGDHRRFMEITYANSYKNFRDAIKLADPEGIVRMSGCQASTAYSGNDYYLLHKYVGYFEAYPVGNQYEYHRSFARPGTIIGGWYGYGASGMSVQNRIWYGLYHGLNFISIFWELSCLNADFTYSQSAKNMARAFKEIKREGIGKLLLNSAVRDDLGIAIHYSMPSVHGTNIIEDKARFENNRQGWLDIMEDLGYQYSFIASDQIKMGELITKGYRVLILPYSIALGKEEAEEIKAFVEDGGVVVGDVQTGLMDEHCKLYNRGKLDDVFGIERLITDMAPFYVNREFVAKKGFPYFNQAFESADGVEDYAPGAVIAEIGIRETTGKAAYMDAFMERVATVVVNEYGKGKGIYMNFSLDQYPTQRKKGDGGVGTREILKKVFSITKVKKYAQLFDKDGKEIEKGYETIYYSNNNAKYICLLRELGGESEVNYDGLMLEGKTAGADNAEELILKLDRVSHVYDIREKKYLGFVDEVKTYIKPGDTKVFSLLPNAVNSIDIKLTDRVKQGDKLTIDITIDGVNPEAYANVVSINVYNHNGEYQHLYSENAIMNGSTYSKTYNTAYNEQKGIWKIDIKDVATGVSSHKYFEVY